MKSIFSIASILFMMTVLSPNVTMAQEWIKEELPTRKTDRKIKEDTKKNDPNRKEIKRIYVEDARKLLYGNPCAIELTHAMGFEYALEHTSDYGVSTWWTRLINNTLVKTKLVFTKGPWWKSTLNKKLKECAKASGDFRG